MADSTFLTKIVEPFVVTWVSERIGHPLRPKKVIVGQRTDSSHVHFNFDGVSKDEKTGLLVSTSLTLKPGGVRKLHVDACVLLRADFERRIMAFISERTLEHFLNKVDGLLPLCEIEMLVCPLTAELQSGVTEFQAIAKHEVGDKGKQWKIGGKRK
jgi:hypothetical protein